MEAAFSMTTPKWNAGNLGGAGRGSLMGLARAASYAVILAAGAFGLPRTALANLVYTIDIPQQYLMGAATDLTGTITTDGTIGILDESDIVSYDLSFAGSEYQGDSNYVYALPGEFALFTDNANGKHYLSWGIADDQGNIGFIEENNPTNVLWFIGDTEISQFFGSIAVPYARLCNLCTLEIGTAPVQWPPVAEPPPIALFGLGLIGLVVFRRHVLRLIV